MRKNSTIANYPASLESKLGFDSVRRSITAMCLGTSAKMLVADMMFSADYDDVKARLQEVAEMMTIRRSDTVLDLVAVDEPSAWLSAARVPGAFIEAADLVSLRNLLKAAAGVVKFFAQPAGGNAEGAISPTSRKYPRLSERVVLCDAHAEVATAIDRVLDRNGEVRDNASPELSRIRQELRGIGARIAGALRRVMAAGVRDGVIEADTAPAMRDGRLVIPVAPMNKRRISGIVHDESATGKTVFIEPAEIVELNNHQRELEMDERREVVRILIELAGVIRPEIDGMLETFEVLAMLDFINAKARYALESGAEKPRISRKLEFEWFGARHPVLQESLERQNRQVVPLNIRLEAPDQRILVISGPNAGGKSVALKTVGIVQYMMQCGLMPTLHGNSTMGIVDGIFTDIGDEQSMEDDLSTYSSHLRNMRHFLDHGTQNTLMLIDEMGSGTEPRIGGAIAQALLGEFNAKGMWGVVTTHYQNLKTMADETPGLVNGSMLYDRQRMQPLFSLAIGHAGSSFALEIARKTGLPASIIERAEEIAGSDYVNLDKYLLDIARDRRYWENKRQNVRQREKHLEQVIERYENNAEELSSARRAIIDDARKQAAAILADSNAAIERTIRTIRQAQAEREATIEARQKLAETRKELEAPTATAGNDAHPLLRKAPKPRKQKKNTQIPSAKAPEITVGSNVLLDGQGTVGEVLELSGNKATVAFGALKMSVETKRLTPTIRKVPTAAKAASFVSAQTTDTMRQRQLQFKAEIDVRGMRADEATQAVTYFMDDAIQFNARRVRILHGTGTGALRMTLRAYLDTVPQVVSYGDEDVRFGGAGITVVNLE